MNKILAFGFFVMCTLAPQAYPQEYEGIHHRPYQRAGIIDDLRDDRSQVIINDAEYRLSALTPIHGRHGQGIPVSRLRIGMYIGFDVTGEGGGHSSHLKEIWVLNRDDRERFSD